jgi:D-sedoheptulose 7-phosphate isomerase
MDQKQKNIRAHFQDATEVLQNFINHPNALLQVERAGELMVSAIQNGGKIMTCGNGGSMCDAMHFAEEMTGRYRENRRPLPAIALSDASHLSCVSNDYGYDFVFSRMLEALGKKEDIFLGISTSGNSKNVLLAAQKAKELGIKIIALTGKDGGEFAKISDIEVRVAHFGYADRIQEIHIKVIHSWIDYIEQKLL